MRQLENLNLKFSILKKAIFLIAMSLIFESYTSKKNLFLEVL